MTTENDQPAVGDGAPASADEGVDTDALNQDLAAEGHEEPPEPELDEDGNPIEPEEDVEELEFEGVKGKVPKALAEQIKLGALRTADYTRKTQEVAQQRAAVEQEAQQVRANLAERTQLVNAHAADLVALKTLDGKLAELEAITPDQWNTARLQDRENGTTIVEDARWELGQLREQKARVEAGLMAKVQQMEADQKQATANLISQSAAELHRSIPGWNGQRLNELQSLAKTFGFTDADLGQAFHPGVYKVLHRLATLEAEANKTTTATTAQRKVATAQVAAPVQKVGGASPPTRKDPAKMSPEEYQAWRHAQKRQQRSAGTGRFT